MLKLALPSVLWILNLQHMFNSFYAVIFSSRFSHSQPTMFWTHISCKEPYKRIINIFNGISIFDGSKNSGDIYELSLLVE